MAFTGRGAITPSGSHRAGRPRRPGATGHSSTTQERNPARVEAGAIARRSSHSSNPPRIASGVASSSASASFIAFCRAMVQARTTPIAVSEASAYATGGIVQIARSRQPGPAASTFIATDVTTAVTLSTRARIARRPCSASAIPSVAKISAATSGIAASSAATGTTPLAAKTIRYCAA
jgi:hypothetical protein